MRLFRKILALLVIISMSSAIMTPINTQAKFTSVAERESHMDTIKYVYYFLRSELDFSPAAACGVLANIERESDFNPNCLSSGSWGQSYGILQWTDNRDSSTFTHLKDWCRENGWDYTTLDGQLNYMKAELHDRNLNDKVNTYPYMHNDATYVPNLPADRNCPHNGFAYPVTDDEQGAWNAGFVWCHYYERPSKLCQEAEARAELTVEAYWPYVPEWENKIHLRNFQMILPEDTFDYTGAKIKPEVIITDGVYQLTQGLDYTLSYSSNKKIGTATVTATGCGDFYGYLTGNFTIQLGTAELASISNTGKGIKLQWKEVIGGNQYMVYRREAGAKSWSKGKLAELNSDKRSYVDKTAEEGKTYFYTVRTEASTPDVYSYDPVGLGITRLTCPALSHMSTTGAGFFKVSWEPVNGAEAYRIYRMTNDTEWERVAEIPAEKLNWTDKTTENGNFYTYTVRAVSAASGILRLSTYDPRGLTSFYMTRQVIKSMESKEEGHLKVRWTKNTAASGYQLEYSTKSDFRSVNTIPIEKNSASSSTLKSLKSGKKYYVRIRSYANINDDIFYSRWSEAAYCKVK